MSEGNLEFTAVGPTNVCLLPAADGYLLVDTSYENRLAALEKSLKKLGAGFSDIRYIVLTHHHNDHVGNLVQLRKNHNFKIIAHNKTAEGLERGELNQPLLPLNRLGAFLLFMLRLTGGRNLTFPSMKVTPDDIVFDDNGLDLREAAGLNATIVHTPGHSDDSVSIVLEDNTAIVGDLCMNLMPIPGSRYFPLLIDSLDKVYASWKKLLEMGVERVIPAHGRPFDSEKLAKLLDKRS